ncbi:hypothetical protein LCGC14_0476390 [marine sediment metagenome]|uniref:Uncharacterized protein n=1 Tax=marine sediment metagenome TaxID=412755 RepID=A0A0F9UXL5_9ZZZZ
MKQRFRDGLHMNQKNKELLETINEIIDEYSMEGYKLTLRQLFYQLVSRDIVPNLTKEYAKLSTLLTKGRMGGVVDWSAIEDRNRVPYIPYSVDDIEDAINDTINQYRLDRQDGQKVHVELWVEKDALSGVLKRITEHYHIKLIVNKGYSSTSAMYDAYRRFSNKINEGKKVVVLYLGDHDPSGLDMIRDIHQRSCEFLIGDAVDFVGDDDESNPAFQVRPIGLTMKQIKQFNPPPNPAKVKDPRSTGYIEKYGKVSWEVDALNPETLHKLVRENVEILIDMNLFNKQIKKEKADIIKLKEMIQI